MDFAKISIDKPRQGFVYFLSMRDPRDIERDFGLVKVGITARDVMGRIAMLQTGNPYELILSACIPTGWPRAVEHFVHRAHATEMLRAEWLRCGRDDLQPLVVEAQAAAERIESRKSKEEIYTGRVSNGRVRRANMREFHVHREARAVIQKLVPAQLDLRIAELQIGTACGLTGGIPGIMRVKIVPATQRFDRRRASTVFPDLAQACQISFVQGGFRWRRVPRPTDFLDQYERLKLVEHAAQAVADEFAKHGAALNKGTARTPELEEWHEQYLDSLSRAYRLEGELAELRTELILALEDHDALDPVCSFVRRTSWKIDRTAFRQSFPAEFQQCQVDFPEQLRKHVYPTRAY